MRPANTPAAFVFSWPCTVPELTNEALMPATPAARSGMLEAGKGGTQAGFVVSRVAPLGKQLVALLFACSIRNEGTIGAASISLMSYARNRRVPRRPMYAAWNTKP